MYSVGRDITVWWAQCHTIDSWEPQDGPCCAVTYVPRTETPHNPSWSERLFIYND